MHVGPFLRRLQASRSYGFVLLLMTISLNIVARLLVRRVAGDGVGQATGG